jgi:hypothetical protein
MTILQIAMMGAKFVVGFSNIHLWYLEESALKFADFSPNCSITPKHVVNSFNKPVPANTVCF